MLSPGEKLGRYEVVSPLGAGGMGEVYRARDSELQRDVAIKILPEEFSSDPDRVKRFEREAKAAAALAHPNVLTVFDVGRQDGRTHLVFEMLAGSTLAEVMKHGALRTREALEYAAQVARGLAAVHARGIVHRDLKPANLFLTGAGIVKIIDFGLARIDAGSPRPPEETTAEVTGPGVALGTVSYMSPEQSQGHVLDARSDIFSLGTVLYEMLAGRHPFKRDSGAATVASILRDDPPGLGRLDGRAAGAVEQLVGRCLEKRPEDRFQSANDLAIALDLLKRGEEWTPAEAPGEARSGGDAEGGAKPPLSTSGARRRWIALFSATLAVVGLALAWLMLRPPLPPARLEPLTSMTGSEGGPTFSPDGEQVAFHWDGEKSDNWDIYVKMVGSPDARRLTSDPAPDVVPSWSPDGRLIAFVRLTPPAGIKLHVISPLGGADRTVTDQPGGFGRPSWSPDGRWLATGAVRAAIFDPAVGERGIRLVRVSDGETRAVTSPSAPAYHIFPAFAPDGRRLAYVSCLSLTNCHIELVDLDGEPRPAGPARRLTRKPISHAFRGSPVWARDGRSLVFPAGNLPRLWRLGTAGDQEPELIELAGHRVQSVAIAAHRDRLAFEADSTRHSIARFVVGRPTETLVASSFGEQFPDYSPDGLRFAFASARNGATGEIWLAGADGSNPTQLTHGPGLWQDSPRFSPDGRQVAFDSLGEDGTWDVWTIDAGGGAPRRFTTYPGDDNLPSWSRDGRFLYWISDRAGVRSIWRAPLAGGPEQRVTESQGGRSYESEDGQTLFFTRVLLDRSPLLAVSLAGGPERTVVDCVNNGGFALRARVLYHVGCVAPLFAREAPLYRLDLATHRDQLLGSLEGLDRGFTIAPDGQSILYTRVQGEGSDLMLIENFR
jgi:eukaryotic-like serine/threonine-protein kinase